jgi:hypothetical protein
MSVGADLRTAISALWQKPIAVQRPTPTLSSRFCRDLSSMQHIPFGCNPGELS